MWDTVFEARPVLFILIGSDIAMMEALTSYDRPLYGRAKELVITPFTVADTAAMVGFDDPATALEAHLVTGGYPRLCLECRRFGSLMAFMTDQLSDENSELVVAGRNVLNAEFPAQLQARQVLSAIGAGERTNKAIADRAGLKAASLARSLHTLQQAKRIVAMDLPFSTKASHDPRYRVADSYLRLWLRFIEPVLPEIARGRADVALARVKQSWPDYRGRAIEPLARESLERLVGDERLHGAQRIGGYWTRTGEVEVDLVGVDRFPHTRRVDFVGSVKWKERSPFDRRDVASLTVQRSKVPGGDQAPLVAVSRSGYSAADLDAAYGPHDLLDAWR